MKRIIFLITLIIMSSCTPKQNLDEFAKCLTENGVVMYGAVGCSHCARTKDMFRDSFQFVTYVECNPNAPDYQTEECLENNIDYFPTWVFNDGSRIIGEVDLDQLSQKSGCAYG